MPDTNILIEIRKQLSEVEGALIIRPQWGAHGDPVGALREVVQLWWFRDVRFAASSQHSVDSRRKPLTGDRRRAREDAVRELEIEAAEGHEIVPLHFDSRLLGQLVDRRLGQAPAGLGGTGGQAPASIAGALGQENALVVPLEGDHRTGHQDKLMTHNLSELP
jgi:hypothetical protein